MTTAFYNWYTKEAFGSFLSKCIAGYSDVRKISDVTGFTLVSIPSVGVLASSRRRTQSLLFDALINVQAPVPKLAEPWWADALVATWGIEALILALGAPFQATFVHIHACVGVLVELVPGRA